MNTKFLTKEDLDTANDYFCLLCNGIPEFDMQKLYPELYRKIMNFTTSKFWAESDYQDKISNTK